jgi:hypothetical protein
VHDPIACDRVSIEFLRLAGRVSSIPEGGCARSWTMPKDVKRFHRPACPGLRKRLRERRTLTWGCDMGLRAMSLEEVYRACPDISLAGSPQAPGAPT